MEINKIEHIKLSLMETVKDMDPSTLKTDYLIKATAKIHMNDKIEKTIIEHSLEEVLSEVYKDIIKENESEVDSIGMWVTYDGKEYEKSIELGTLNDMERFSDEQIYPIFELFKLLSPVEKPKNK